MDELVRMVVERTGIPEDKARTAVQVVASYLKDKVPGPLAAQIDSALAGGGSGGMGDMLGKMGV